MVKLADTPDLGSGGEIRGGSSPSSRTIKKLNVLKLIKKYFLCTYLILIVSIKCKADSYDYALGFVVEACKVTLERKKISNIEDGLTRYRTCMNFIMSLSSSLNSRCIMAKEGSLSPENALLYADLSQVNSTADLVTTIIDYHNSNPHFSNQLAWVHASKALSQKWPCKDKY